jgi:D-inositol-3-phosphate glycosyltransferase
MNILFICENYIPHYGGAEVVFKNLAEGYAKKGHKVILLTRLLQGTKKKEIINGVKVIRVPSFDSRYFFTFFSIPKAIKLARWADVIQTTTFNGAPPAWLAGKIVNTPTVLTIHEVWVNKWNKVTNLGKISCSLHNLLEKAIYLLNFDSYVCVSKATEKDLLKIKKDSKKVRSIHNGMDYNFWNPKNFDGNKLKKETKFKDNFICFSWGRPGTSKGFEYLIKAVPMIKVKNFKLVLMFGSVDKYKNQYQEFLSLIKRLNIEDKVEIIPSVPYEQLGDYISMADCVVVPSIAEGFGYNVVETNSLGTPVVATTAGSIPEVISGKHILVSPKSPSEIALAVEKVSKKEFLETTTKKFLWEKSISDYLELYQNILRKN